MPSIATVLVVLGLAFGALLAATPRAAAVTYVTRAITADTTWGTSDTVYVITSWVTVRPGVTLTILPGVQVRVDPARVLFVEGRLVADGTSTSPIKWVRNSTILLLPPGGVQFNASATGSVSWNTFDRFDRPLNAVDSSPSFAWNTITTASWGVGLVRSAATVSDNKIDNATLGITLSESSAQILRNTINRSALGVQATVAGAPHIANNVIKNISQSSFSVGIYIQRGVSADLWWNTIGLVQGARGPDGSSPGLPGGAGGVAAGILVDSAPSATVTGNTVNMIAGGRGGDGTANAGGTGGLGGVGGGGVAIVIANTPSVSALGNIISNVYGGRGGNGGGGGSTATGGDGGTAGGAAGIEALGSSSSATWESNSINGVTGGVGGNGGGGTGADGRGGLGGEADGIAAWNAMNGNAWGNFIFGIRGGPGGNSTAVGLGNNHGGDGGAAVGLGLTAASGSSQVLQNTMWQVTGGLGGRGATAGTGGNATGGYMVGNPDRRFNATSATQNNAIYVTGGAGGVGTRIGGNGGGALGLAVALVTPTLRSNSIQTITGGRGGDALDLSDGGRGGDATGALAFLVLRGSSALDTISTVAQGAVGAGPPAQPSTAVGWSFLGNATFTTQMTVENGTLTSTGDLDLQVNDDVAATTINTTFSEARLSIVPTSLLTVKNYLGVDVFWPNGLARVTGASILVRDEGNPVWNFVSPTGRARWLLVTDRVYEGAIPARDNRTEVTVTYLSYSFANDPRMVDMGASNTQAFVMIDRDAPSATASALPTYETAATFNVGYTATDGNGVGIGNVTLWWRMGGGWNAYATQPGGASGTFSFTATGGDGTYEFAATADDRAGNQEPNPGANETWTTLDTVRPGSHVNAQPTWHNTASFLVSWAPDSGVTDIVSYTIEYNHASGGWTAWLAVTAGTTSATFTASPASGVYEFRSIARDAAGNVEVAPATNDTWTIVDMQSPSSTVAALPAYETSLSFPVSWALVGDSYDIASYRIDVNDGTGWAVWITSPSAGTSTFAGADGRTYEFRSIATDYAGNVQAPPATNDTWTHVDVTPPDSRVTPLPAWETAVTFGVTWAPVSGTTDIATYTLEVSDDGAAWTAVAGYVDTTLANGTFTGADGHSYAFRSIAKDRAGNVEVAPAGNDTWTTVDITPPTSTASLAGTAGGAGWYVSTVAVTLAATDATSGVASVSYRVDGGAWQAYAAPFTVSGEGSHAVDYRAQDRAGLTETLQSTTFKIDLTPPTTTAALLGAVGDNAWYVSPVNVSLSANDARSGVGSITYRVDGGTWQTYAAPFNVVADGSHVVDFYATDNAGLPESMKNATFKIDATAPLIVTTAPRGTGTNTTPAIVVTFSEAMDHASAQAAFSITPDISGAFRWSADSKTMTFAPDRPLEAGRDYSVTVAKTAKDLAGNPLAAPSTFQFTTSSTGSPSGGGGTGDSWWILAVVAAAVIGALFVAMRMLRAKPEPAPPAAAKKDEQATIDDVFLLYHDGILIKHETRRLKPDVDTDILSGMLTAVQSFVKDSFRTEEGELDELTFGAFHILIVRGKWLILAAMVQGDGTVAMKEQIEKCVQDMETNQAEAVENWDGNMSFARVLSPYIKKLIRGEYA